MLNGARATRRWPMADQKTKCFKPIPGRVAHNTLLKATFGLKLLHLRLPYRMREVVWAARYEMARTVEDVLARRTRALFLDAKAAIEAAPAVADVLAKELGKSAAWREKDLQNFFTVAQGYVYLGE